MIETMTPPGVEQFRYYFTCNFNQFVIETMTPPGVEQRLRAAFLAENPLVIETMTPPGVEQHEWPISMAEAARRDRDDDASGR